MPQTKEVASVESFISQAVSTGASVETLERLFSLREKVKAETAKEAFVVALAAFQEACPVIEKNKKVLNKDGRTVRYMYASLDGIAAQIRNPLARNGFSYSWDTVHKEGHMQVTCKLTHKLGHFETSTLEIPIVESEGFMTSPQKYASAQTYAKRYTLLNVLGIATADEDTDATDVEKEKSAKSDKAKIMFLLRSLGSEIKTKEQIEAAVLKHTGLALGENKPVVIVERLEEIVKRNQSK